MGNCLVTPGNDSLLPSNNSDHSTAADPQASRSGSTGCTTEENFSKSLGSSTTTEGKLSSSTGSSVGQFSVYSEGAEDLSMFPHGRVLPSANLRVFTFAELKSATKNFKSDTVLGEGGFGKVFKGWVDEKTMNPTRSGHGKAVAIKKLNSESMQGWQEWQSEVNFLGRLSHPNLVKLLGYCGEENELLLVYEFMSKGSLENHLFRRGSAAHPLTWDLRLKIAKDAARGLAFLHASERKIIYRDFKASNILLDSNYNAKISDFGLAKHGPEAGESHVTTRVMGTFGYAAPEYVNTGHLYVKSDVYGFGVVLLELLSGHRALDLNRPAGQQNLVDWARPFLSTRKKFSHFMDPQLKGQYSSKVAIRAAQLTLRCIASEPKNRPSMDDVVESLEQIEAMQGKPEALKVISPLPGARNRGAMYKHQRSPYHRAHDSTRLVITAQQPVAPEVT